MPAGRPTLHPQQLELVIAPDGTEVVVGRIVSKDQPKLFVYDAADAGLFEHISQWHLTNKYVSTNTIYMHRLVLGLHDNAEDQNVSGDHASRHVLDNRRCNLRLATQRQQNFNRGDSERAATLPEECGILLQDLPRYIQFRKSRGLHFEHFAVCTNNFCWATSKSKNLSLKEKFEQAKHHLRHLVETRPECFVDTCYDPVHVALSRSLRESFNAIIMASSYPNEEKLANLADIREERSLLAPNPMVRQVPLVAKSEVLIRYSFIEDEGQPKYVHLEAERADDTIHTLYDFKFHDLVQSLSLQFDAPGARVTLSDGQKQRVPWLKNMTAKKMSLREILYRQHHQLPADRYLSAYSTNLEDLRMENLVSTPSKAGMSPNAAVPEELQQVMPDLRRLPKYSAFETGGGRSHFKILKHPGLVADNKSIKHCNSSIHATISEKYEDLLANLTALYARVGQDFRVEDAKWNRLHDEFIRYTS